MKKILKVYIEQENIEKLKKKAEALGFVGRGSISRYILKISQEDIAFLDSNVKAILNVLGLKPALK